MLYEKLPIVLLTAAAVEKRGNINETIAKYIMAHRHELNTLSIRDLAHRCHVGIASVSRFCKEIGLNDFSELKELVSSDFRFSIVDHTLEPAARLNTYRDHITACVADTCASLSMDEIRQLCRDIQRHDRVLILGMLKAAGVAFNLATDLALLGKQTEVKLSLPQQVEALLSIQESTLVIVFSYTGTYFDYDLLPSAPPKAAHIVMIAGSQPKQPYIRRVIHFKSDGEQLSHPYQLQIIASIIAQEYAQMLQQETRPEREA